MSIEGGGDVIIEALVEAAPDALERVLRERLRACVLAESVYNCLSLMRRDMTPFEVVNQLRARWQPAWGKVDEVVTVESVRRATDELGRLGLVMLVPGDDVEVITIPIRDQRTNAGRHITTDYERGELTWAGKAGHTEERP